MKTNNVYKWSDCQTRDRKEHYRVAIIGAGIYGCHLALALKARGHEVDLYDMSDDLFSGASTYNSFRIHKGYHYPRSGKTREMCMRDEKEFTEFYGHLTSKAQDNPKIFCVANDERTLIDFSTMKFIMQGSGMPFEELSLEELNRLGFESIEGGFRVHESIFLVDKAKHWFKQELLNKGVNLKLRHCIDKIETCSNKKINIANEEYDFAINCTYNQALSYHSQRHSHYFDLCFSLIVASKKPKEECNIKSFGIFDGAYPSLEPYGYSVLPEKYAAYHDRKLFQIFHVKHTSVCQYAHIENARIGQSNGLDSKQLANLTHKILSDTKFFFPRFDEEFEVIGHCLALKTKVNDLSDTRPLIVVTDEEQHPNFIQVFSSKLTSIFTAEEQVMKLIDQSHKKLLAA